MARIVKTRSQLQLEKDLHLNRILQKGERLKLMQEEAREMNRIPIQILESEVVVDGEDSITFEVLTDNGEIDKRIDGIIVSKKDIESGDITRFQCYSTLGEVYEQVLKEAVSHG